MYVKCTHFTICVTHYLVSGISFPTIFVCLLIMKTHHSHLISNTSVHHFLHHHCQHPLLLFSTPGSKLIFSTNTFLHSSSTFSPTRLTPWTLRPFFIFLRHVGFSIVCYAKLASFKCTLNHCTLEVDRKWFFLFRPKNKTTECEILFFGRKINEK